MAYSIFLESGIIKIAVERQECDQRGLFEVIPARIVRKLYRPVECYFRWEHDIELPEGVHR